VRPEGLGQFKKSTSPGLEYNIKMDFKEMGCDLVHLTQDMAQW
jgi:hypothetical protein